MNELFFYLRTRKHGVTTGFDRRFDSNINKRTQCAPLYASVFLACLYYMLFCIVYSLSCCDPTTLSGSGSFSLQIRYNAITYHVIIISICMNNDMQVSSKVTLD